VLGTDGIKANYCQWPTYNNTFLDDYGDASQWCRDVNNGNIGYEQSLDCTKMMEYFFAPQDNFLKAEKRPYNPLKKIRG